MKICYEGETLDFDLEELTLYEATVIYKRLGLTLLGLDQGLTEGNPDALRAIYWMMRHREDPKINIEEVDFKIVKFATAVKEAADKEEAEATETEIAAKAGSPKEK